MATDERMRAFVDRHTARGDVLAVILFGSHARGNPRPDSDIDLLVIRREGHARVVEYHEGQAFEVVYETEEGARAFWDANGNDAFGLWQVAQVLHDQDGPGARLRSYGDRVLATRPPPPTAEHIAHAHFDAMDTLRAVEVLLESDPATAAVLTNRMVDTEVELFFRLRGEWTPPPKQRIDAVRRVDSALGGLVNRFHEARSPTERTEVASLIVERVFASIPAGGPTTG